MIDVKFLEHQKEFSEKTFGPGMRTKGVIAHIRKELEEIESDPTDLTEWVDVIILALDGAWRSGHSPQEVLDRIAEKQAENETRQWGDWRVLGEDSPIEHIRAPEVY